jgi:hypothetical protein
MIRCPAAVTFNPFELALVVDLGPDAWIVGEAGRSALFRVVASAGCPDSRASAMSLSMVVTSRQRGGCRKPCSWSHSLTQPCHGRRIFAGLDGPQVVYGAAPT